jgi:geranylgeranyl diphosphate synthase type II
MDFEKELLNLREKFENRLNELTLKWDFPTPLAESMKYALTSGGKRFRPTLLLCAYKVFAADVSEIALDFAIAIELIHTYSLVHDDLPCMDDDDYRRGKLTVHKKFSEDIAVLCGDALLNKAFEIIFGLIEKDKKAIKAATKLATKTGAGGLIGGQVKDLQCSTNKDITIDDLNYVYTHKTCDLIVAAVECGAILAGATDEEVAAMVEFGYNFGYVFQLVDDLLDEGSENEFSALRLYTKDEILKIIVDRNKKAIEALEKIDKNTEALKYLSNKSTTRTV